MRQVFWEVGGKESCTTGDSFTETLFDACEMNFAGGRNRDAMAGCGRRCTPLSSTV